MLSSVRNFTRSTRKLYRLVHVALAVLALMLLLTPSGLAAGEPTQSAQTPPSQSQPQALDATCPPDGQCFADVPPANPFYAFINRIYQQDLVSGYPCGGSTEPCDSENRPYYRPVNDVTRQQMAKFIDNARRLPQIHMETSSPDAAIYISSTGTSALTGVIYAETYTSTAIYGKANGGGIGVRGDSGSFGVYGTSTGGYGVWGVSDTGTGVVATGVQGEGLYAGSQGSNGVEGYSSSGNGVGVVGRDDISSGVKGTSTNGWGVWGVSTSNYGVFGSSTSYDAIYGQSTSRSGVVGVNTSGGVGVSGQGEAQGVHGQSSNGFGVFGYSPTGTGVEGDTTTGTAGFFHGNVTVTGTCTGCAGPDTIDDPADPTGKFLNQSTVESSDMMNIYNGNATLDDNGEATVQMPDWFESLNQDFRYQLTAIGAPGPNLYIAEEITDNHFKIAGGQPGSKVSWQVTGVRHDPFSTAHQLPVEQDKPADQQGKYLHPAEYGQPASSGIYQSLPEQQLAQPSKP